jgi:hypothetical protein
MGIPILIDHLLAFEEDPGRTSAWTGWLLSFIKKKQR